MRDDQINIMVSNMTHGRLLEAGFNLIKLGELKLKASLKYGVSFEEVVSEALDVLEKEIRWMRECRAYEAAQGIEKEY